MNKILAGILAVSMSAGLVSAQEQTNVLSRNAVGYVKQAIEGGKLYLISNPMLALDDAEGSHSLTNMLAAAPNNSVVSVWDNNAQTYVNYTRGARGAWLGDAVSAKIEQGQPFFLRVPAAAAPAEIILMGEVPSENIPQSRVAGLTFLSNPFPASRLLTNTSIGVSAPNNSVISVWNPNTQQYVNYTKGARGTWLGDAATAELEPGQAFIVRSSAAPNSWTEVKPYTWP